MFLIMLEFMDSIFIYNDFHGAINEIIDEYISMGKFEIPLEKTEKIHLIGMLSIFSMKIKQKIK